MGISLIIIKDHFIKYDINISLIENYVEQHLGIRSLLLPKIEQVIVAYFYRYGNIVDYFYRKVSLRF